MGVQVVKCLVPVPVFDTLSLLYITGIIYTGSPRVKCLVPYRYASHSHNYNKAPVGSAGFVCFRLQSSGADVHYYFVLIILKIMPNFLEYLIYIYYDIHEI